MLPGTDAAAALVHRQPAARGDQQHHRRGRQAADDLVRGGRAPAPTARDGRRAHARGRQRALRREGTRGATGRSATRARARGRVRRPGRGRPSPAALPSPRRCPPAEAPYGQPRRAAPPPRPRPRGPGSRSTSRSSTAATGRSRVHPDVARLRAGEADVARLAVPVQEVPGVDRVVGGQREGLRAQDALVDPQADVERPARRLLGRRASRPTRRAPAGGSRPGAPPGRRRRRPPLRP